VKNFIFALFEKKRVEQIVTCWTLNIYNLDNIFNFVFIIIQYKTNNKQTRN